MCRSRDGVGMNFDYVLEKCIALLLGPRIYLLLPDGQSVWEFRVLRTFTKAGVAIVMQIARYGGLPAPLTDSGH